MFIQPVVLLAATNKSSVERSASVGRKISGPKALSKDERPDCWACGTVMEPVFLQILLTA